jgi:hypothetical protein
LLEIVEHFKANEFKTFYDFYNLHKRRKSDGDESERAGELNSLWGLIGSIAKYFRFSWHEIMFEISYANLMMMLASYRIIQ